MGNLLSIIITNKDDGDVLPRQLECIASQRVQFDEVILIDDGSSDNSKEVMRNFKTDNPEINVKLFLHDENKGVAIRDKEGTLASECKFLYFASSDDYVYPTFAKEYKSVIEAGDSDVKLISSSEYDRSGYVFPDTSSNYDRIFDKVGWNSHGTVLERDTLLEFGGHNPKLEFHCDWFFIHSIAFTHGFFAIPMELSHHTLREDAFSNTKYPREKSMEIYNEMIRVLNEEEAYSDCKEVMTRICNATMRKFIWEVPKTPCEKLPADESVGNNVSIGIIITNKDDGSCLPVQLDSIAAQVVLPDELILIDDGSTDNSKDVMKKFRDDHPEINVKIFLHNENAGVVRRCNQGLYASDSKYLYFTGSDDFIYPTFIQEHKKALQESPIGEVCNCEDCKHRNYAEFKLSSSANYSQRGFISAEMVRASNYASIPGHCSCVDRETLIDIGGFNPILEAQCDWFAYMIISHKCGFYTIPTMLSGVQHKAKGKISSYATEFKETKENIHIAKEMVRVIRQKQNQSFTIKMLIICMDRFRFSPDWLRVIVDAFLEVTELKISERPEEE